MKKRILFFGLGSIGIRHVKLLIENFQCEIAAYRTGTKTNKLKIQEFSNLNDAFNFKPEIAFVTNPTSLHIKTAIECAKRGIHLFIEKPLSNSKDGIEKLIELIKQNNVYSYVAFCMRFHPVIKYLQDYVDTDCVYYARSICSSYLPLWRPEQNFRESYSAKPSMGGGVLNELSHELDYNEFLFGKIKKLKGVAEKISHLEVSSEDYSELLLQHKTEVKSHISLDFFSHYKERSIKIYTPDEVVIGDIENNQVSKYKNYRLIEKIDFDKEDIYLTQLKYFFKNYEEKNHDVMSTVSKSKNLTFKIAEFSSKFWM